MTRLQFCSSRIWTLQTHKALCGSKAQTLWPGELTQDLGLEPALRHGVLEDGGVDAAAGVLKARAKGRDELSIGELWSLPARGLLQ